MPVEADTDRGVNRPVRDLPVPDLDDDRVDEDRSLYLVERPADQSCLSSSTLSVIREMVSFETEAP